MTKKERLLKRLERIDTQLGIAYDTYEKLLAEDNQSYRFDSGEGSQQTRKRNPEDIKKQIESLESEAEKIRRRLKGLGLVGMSVNRKRGFYFR